MAAETTPLAAFRNGVVFFAALAAASSALSTLAGFPSLGNLTRKYQHIVDHGADYSLVYVGSSRVFHEFIPARFDAELAARGHTVGSFNFGQDGMWPPESFYLLRKILAARPARLKWVLVDLMGIRPELEGSETTLRAIYWHDLHHTWIALRHIIETAENGRRTVPEKLLACLHHSGLFLQRSCSLGTGHRQLELLLGLKQRKTPVEVTDGGYEPGKPGPLDGNQRATFLAALGGLKRNPQPRPIPASFRDALATITADVRAAGAEPVFVVASNLYGAERFTDWPPAGVTVLAFDDPEKYAQLYDPDHRFDPHHLDPAGAEDFTRLLAARFAELLDTKR